MHAVHRTGRFYVVTRPVKVAIGWMGTSRASSLDFYSPGKHKDAKGGVENDLPVAFNVYLPDAGFRKRDAGPPDYHAVVCRYDDAMPSHAALTAMANSSPQHSATPPCTWTRNKQPMPRGSRQGIDSAFEVDQPCDILSKVRNVSEVHTHGIFSNAEVPDGVARQVDVLHIECGGCQEADSKTHDPLQTSPTTDNHGGLRDDAHAGQMDDNTNTDQTRTCACIKLAVVAANGAVHLFDVGVHECDGLDLA